MQIPSLEESDSNGKYPTLTFQISENDEKAVKEGITSPYMASINEGCGDFIPSSSKIDSKGASKGTSSNLLPDSKYPSIKAFIIPLKIRTSDKVTFILNMTSLIASF